MNEKTQICIDKIRGTDPYQRDPSGAIAGITALMWEPGTTLKIKFLEGDPNVIKKVKEKFNLWLPHANTIKFEYVDDDSADVRITFKENDGHWSWLGKEIKDNPNKEPTMNFGWDHNSEIPDDDIERVAVHEMGHTLGFIHEQSQPKAKIDWDEEKVYEFYKQNQGWDEETIFHNVLERYGEQITQYTEYDPISIMHYWFPGFLLKSGKDIPGGDKLSDLDKKFAMEKYGSKNK
jgi:serralysin